jgi:imidazolonepropionase-like amidohydrolase
VERRQAMPLPEYPQTVFVDAYPPGREARVELRNGRFLDVANGAYFPTGTRVVVRAGRIESMPGTPAGAAPDFTIDLQGRAVVPGLFNTHCHTSLTFTTMAPTLRDICLGKSHAESQRIKNMADCVIRGVTNIRDAYTANLRTTTALTDSISKCKMRGPRITQAVVVGPPGSYLAESYGLGMRFLRSVTGIPTVDHSRRESGVVVFPVDATEQQVRDAVDRAIDERGAEVIKIGEQRESMMTLKPGATIMTLAQLEALADQARRRGLKTMMHHVSVDSFRRGVKAGVSVMSHSACDAPLTAEDVAAFKASGTMIEPTISVAYGLSWQIKGDPNSGHPQMRRLTEFRDRTYTYAELADEFFVPELRRSVTGSYDKLSRGRFRALGVVSMSKYFKYYASVVAHGTDNLRLLFDGGADIALANDGGIPPCTPAMMGFELVMLDRSIGDDRDGSGLTGAEAARIATINSARAMGLEDRFGSIEPGKTADLVVVEGDPLEDFRVLGGRAAALFLDGRLVINNCGLRVEAAGAV